jgi:hypothetical protein
VSPPALLWNKIGQVDVTPHEPKRYEGYGPPEDNDTTGSEFGDTYTNLDTGEFFELSASDGTFGTPFDGPPDAPGGLTVTSSSEDTLAGNVRLEWPSALHADWYNILYRDYVVPEEDTRGPNDELNFLWQGISTAYTAHIYTPGTYEFVVNAGNNDLSGGNSATDARVGPVVVETGSTTHGPEAVPGPAENLQVTDNVPGAVTFTWEPPSDTRLGDASWYVVESSPPGADTWSFIEPAVAFPGTTTTIATVPTTGTNTLIPGTYDFHILSLSEYGSANSDPITDIVIPGWLNAEPAPPLNMGVSQTADNVVTVTWDHNDDTDYSPPSYYAVQISDDAGATWADITNDPDWATSSDMTVGASILAGTHKFRVSAVNDNGSAASNEEDFEVTSPTLPGPPPDFGYQDQGHDNLYMFSWGDANPATYASPDGFQLQNSIDDGTTWTDFGSTTTDNSTEVPVTTGTYKFRVSAYNDNGIASSAAVDLVVS